MPPRRARAPPDSATQHLHDHDAPSSDPPEYSSPAADRTAPLPSGPVSTFDSKPADSKSLGDAVSSAGNPSTSGSVSGTTAAAASSVASSVKAAVPTSTEELKAQLADATATIARLTEQAKEQGLRQRKTDAVAQDARERVTAGGTTGQGVQQTAAGADGVPVQIVAALCLLSFLLAYLFF